jgi:hypothetical protein
MTHHVRTPDVGVVSPVPSLLTGTLRASDAEDKEKLLMRREARRHGCVRLDFLKLRGLVHARRTSRICAAGV